MTLKFSKKKKKKEVKCKIYAKLHVPNFTHLLSRKGFEVFHGQLKTRILKLARLIFSFSKDLDLMYSLVGQLEQLLQIDQF